MRVLFYFVFCFIVFLPSFSYAACTSPVGIEGEMFYTATFKTMQFCDGTDWWDMKSGGGAGSDSIDYSMTPPTGCSNIGDVCADGTVYAGIGPFNLKPLLTTAADAPGTYTWNAGGTGIKLFTPVSESNGKANTTVEAVADCETGVGQQDCVAGKYCADLSADGHDDWYLPANLELLVLYNNQAAIGGFSAATYWSSRETSDTLARYANLSTGGEGNGSKATSYNVRCVRRD